jgi:septum formation protein
MFDNLKDFKIVLASNSPRRKELLTEMGLTFSVMPSQGEETYSAELNSSEIAEFLAIQKADWFTDFTENQLYITADTIVICEGNVLGKPHNSKEAFDILNLLSGKNHAVVTGMCLKTAKNQISFSCITQVAFKHLSKEEISYYVTHYLPFDKAGAYGIQEWIGMIGISKIIGSYYNVVGMPVDVLFDKLKGIK